MFKIEQNLDEQVKSNTNNTYTILIDRPEPVYIWAEFKHQGIGRVIEHTVTTCIMAMHTNRPCVINLTPRDEYHTFRSFPNIGTLNWYSDLADQVHFKSIEDAIRKLDKSKNSWADPPPAYEDIIPMTKLPYNRANIEKAYTYWRDQPSKLLGSSLVWTS